MQYVLYVNLYRCVGCHACEVACRQEHNIPLNEWRIKVFETEPEITEGKLYAFFIPVTSEKCTLCKNLITNGINPACVASCPTKALKFSDKVEQLTKLLYKKEPISILKIVNLQ